MGRKSLIATSLAVATLGCVDAPTQVAAEHAASATTVAYTTCTLVTSSSYFAQATVPKPVYLGSYIDPVFHTKITRVTGDPGIAIPTVGSTWGQVSRHHYSKDAVWSADQRLIALDRVDNVSGILFLDGDTYRPLFSRTKPGGGETRWHPTLADVMLYVKPSPCEAGYWNVRTNVVTPIYRYKSYSACEFGPFEGNPSSNGAMLAVNATRVLDGHRVGFVLDLVTPKKYPDLDLAAVGVTSLGWLSVSPLGDLLVVKGTIDNAPDATRVFTLRGVPVGTPWLEYGRPSHFDMSLDVSGNEVAVGVSKSAPDNGRVIMRRLRDGVVTVLTPGGYASHTSTRNYTRPGWAYVTHTNDSYKYPPFGNEVFAVRLDGSMALERIAQLHDLDVDYLSEAHAVPSPDGRRVLFASDWMHTTGRPVQAYIADERGLCH